MDFNAIFWITSFFELLYLISASSNDNGFYYPPVYGSFADNTVMMTRGYSGNEPKMTPHTFEVRVYEVQTNGKRVEGKSTSYSPLAMSPTYGRMMEKPQVPMVMAYPPPPKKVHKTKKCFQCEYRPPRPETFEVLIREPFKVQVPKTIQECTWEKSIDYVYKKPRSYSGRMYGHYETVPKWDKVCVPKTVYETETKFKNRYITKKRMSPPGGFEACKGPIDAYSAKHSGVDDWDCYNNCFIKMDKRGTVSRGCYSGQYKVDPNLLGCHYQGDNKQDMYCFCDGDRCNGQEVPNPMSSYGGH